MVKGWWDQSDDGSDRFVITSDSGKIAVTGEPAVELQSWAESVLLKWNNATLCWTVPQEEGFNPWSLAVDEGAGEFIECTISPPIGVPEAAQIYYEIDAKGNPESKEQRADRLRREYRESRRALRKQ